MTANNDALAVALDAIDRGYSPVPVPVGKKPNLKNWPKLRVTAETASRHFNGARSSQWRLLRLRSQLSKWPNIIFPMDWMVTKSKDVTQSLVPQCQNL